MSIFFCSKNVDFKRYSDAENSIFGPVQILDTGPIFMSGSCHKIEKVDPEQNWEILGVNRGKNICKNE